MLIGNTIRLLSGGGGQFQDLGYRWAIAEAGYQRAMKDHTYEKRIEFIFSIINQS